MEMHAETLVIAGVSVTSRVFSREPAVYIHEVPDPDAYPVGLFWYIVRHMFARIAITNFDNGTIDSSDMAEDGMDAMVDFVCAELGRISKCDVQFIKRVAGMASSWFRRSQSFALGVQGRVETVSFEDGKIRFTNAWIRTSGEARLAITLKMRDDSDEKTTIVLPFSDLQKHAREEDIEARRRIMAAVANVRMTRIVRKNLEAIKARLWRPDGPLAIAMIDKARIE